jgi:hypothetical protein
MSVVSSELYRYSRRWGRSQLRLVFFRDLPLELRRLTPRTWRKPQWIGFVFALFARGTPATGRNRVGEAKRKGAKKEGPGTYT